MATPRNTEDVLNGSEIAQNVERRSRGWTGSSAQILRTVLENALHVGAHGVQGVIL